MCTYIYIYIYTLYYIIPPSSVHRVKPKDIFAKDTSSFVQHST